MIEGNNETLFIPGHFNTQNKRSIFLQTQKSLVFAFHFIIWHGHF